MKLVERKAGDRVRLPDGRIVELAWGFWWHGTTDDQQASGPTDKRKGRKQPDAWFVREIVEDWEGNWERLEPFDLDSSTEVEAVISSWAVKGKAEDPGAEYDPLRPATKGELL